MLKSLKTTTALVASLNLIVPFPALAQAVDAQDRAVEACSTDITSVDCITATQDAVNAGADPAELQERIQAEADADVDMNGTTTEGDTSADIDASTDTDMDASADTQADTDAGASADTPAVSAEPATPAVPAEPATPAAPADAGTATDTTATETPTEAAPETSPAPEAAPEETATDDMPSEQDLEQLLEGDTATDTDMDTATGADATADTDMNAETDATADTDVNTDADASADTDVNTDADASADTDMNADADTSADTATDLPATDTDTATDDNLPSTDELQQQLGDADAEDDATAEGDTVTDIGAETSAQTSTVSEAEATDTATESEQAAIEGTAPVAAAASENAEAVETETTTVEDTRSSSEDFEGTIQAQPANGNVQAQSSNDDDNDDEDGISGLTDLEKALVLGAGALGVGLLLRGNQQIVASSNDRVVVSGSDGGYELIKDDNSLLLSPGAQVQNQTFDDGSSRSTVTYEDGTQIVTIRDDQLRVVRRVRISPNGEQVVLIDDLNQNIQPVNVQQLQQSTQQSQVVDISDQAALRQALATDRTIDRAYSLSQVRNIAEVRQQVPAIDLEAITFETGSAAIRPEQADELRGLGQYIRDRIAENPREIFLVEGHTDTVGNAPYNLALSDRRAESVALALTEYFDVPASNLVVQGYGERFLKVEQEGDIRANRRATVRDVTPLLQVAAAN